MTDPVTVDEAIEQVALGMVQSQSENGRSMQTISIEDLVKAARHLAGSTAATQPHFGMRMTKCIPPRGG